MANKFSKKSVAFSVSTNTLFSTIKWTKFPDLTTELVAIGIENRAISDGLFHESNSKKNDSGQKKDHWYSEIAKDLFENCYCGAPDFNLDVKNPAHLAKLESEYGKMVSRLNTTGEGLHSDSQINEDTESDGPDSGSEDENSRDDSHLEKRTCAKASAQNNLIAQYRQSWPWWDDLHNLWKDRPNYNSSGVQNAAPGTQHDVLSDKLIQPPSTKPTATAKESQSSMPIDLALLSSSQDSLLSDIILSPVTPKRKAVEDKVQSSTDKAHKARLDEMTESLLQLRNHKAQNYLEMQKEKNRAKEAQAALGRSSQDSDRVQAHADRDAGFQAEMIRFPCLIEEWNAGGCQGPRPSVPKY
ncbi:hypothetical protein EDC01DRAFT_632088 [Geopyxis carbonaria]|nr:hypothetical protein EDC01DRAFT_632088 [Geopyxis carbonaria]